MSQTDEFRDEELGDNEFNDEEESIEILRYKDLQEIQQKGISRKDYHEVVVEIRQFIAELGQSRDFDEYRKEVESLFRTFETTYGKVQSDFQLCDARNKEIYEKTMKVRQVYKQSQEDYQRLRILKNSFEQASKDLDQLRDSETKTHEQIKLLNEHINVISNQLETGEGAIIPESKELESLQAEYAEVEKERNKGEDRKMILAEAISKHNNGIKEVQKQIKGFSDLIATKNKDIDRFNAEHMEGEEKHKAKSILLQRKREEVEKLKQEIEENSIKLQNALSKEALEKELVEKLEGDLVKSKASEVTYEERIAQIKFQQKKEEERKKKRKQELEKGKDELATLRKEKEVLEDEAKQLIQELYILESAKNQKNPIKKDLDMQRTQVKQRMEDLNHKLEAARREIESKENHNKALEQTRNAFDKRLMTEEAKEKAQKNLEITYKNQISRMQSEITVYRFHNQQLHKQNTQLEAEKQKYSADAVKANIKYIETVEEVKEKEKMLENVQKRNKDIEEKLKNQQKLYECVRSDRNLYSKNLLEQQEEIKELDKKFKILTNDINHLKEEKTSKDVQLANSNRDLENIKAKNLNQDREKTKIKRDIEALNQLYRTQTDKGSDLNHVIEEAEAERTRQRKDYEIVINERDILGNQLIKRTDELHLLYEKIKIQQSGLARGKMKYQQIVNTVKDIKDEIAQCKRNIALAKGEISCIDNLKKESITLYKEVQEERLKAAMLNEELKKKMNYHKWKELEGKDPSTYNLIMKIHSLQRRLIAKTEELAEKDVLIKEKETLYVELKNILAKQSGPEVAEKLEVYQQNLKERVRQLKQYMKELQAYQAQVSAYNYEIERLEKKVTEVKQNYFKKRKNETNQVRTEPIPEEEELGPEPDLDEGLENDQQEANENEELKVAKEKIEEIEDNLEQK